MKRVHNWTHAELVERAGRWLQYSAHVEMDLTGNAPRVTRCGVVLLEPQGGSENPDAIGWFNRGYHSILIECKANRRDFLIDKTKYHRRAGEKAGMGRYRFYMAPPGVIAVADLSHTKWGILEVVGRSVKTLKLSGEFEFFADRERELLWSTCRKYQQAERDAYVEEMGR